MDLSCLTFILLVIQVLFPVMYVSLKDIFGLIWFLICRISLLTSLYNMTCFSCDTVGGVWELIISIPDRGPSQFENV